MRWTPSFDPQSRQQIEDFAERARRPLARRSALAAALASILTLAALIASGAPLVSYWASLILLALGSIALLDRYGREASYRRVLKKTERLYGDKPRQGVRGSSPHAQLKATSQEDSFGRKMVGVGIWRVKGGVWSQAGWNERPQWFEDAKQAEAFERSLAEEL